MSKLQELIDLLKTLEAVATQMDGNWFGDKQFDATDTLNGIYDLRADIRGLGEAELEAMRDAYRSEREEHSIENHVQLGIVK